MATVTADFVKEVIRTQGVDTLVAEDMRTGEQIGFLAGNAVELCSHVDFMEENFGTPYRLKASRSAQTGKPGKPKPDQRSFVWEMLGRTGAGKVAAPANGTPAPAPAARGHELSADVLIRCAKAEAEVEFLKRENQRLEDAVEDLEEEAEKVLQAEKDKPIQAAPPPLKWYETTEGVKMFSQEIGLKDLIAGLRSTGKLRNANPPQNAAAAPVAGPPELGEVSAEEVELLRAARNYRTLEPEQSAEIFGVLREKYLNAATDGKANA